MAGSYSDVPGHRMAYDRDGTAAFLIGTNGAVAQKSASALTGGNDESLSTVIDNEPNSTDTGLRRFGLIFPELRDVAGITLMGDNYNGWGNVETSPDTTNGLDGTWTSRGSAGSFVTSHNVISMRTGIVAVSWVGTKGIRVGYYGGPNDQRWPTMHVYGSPAAGQAASRLRFWHPTLDQEVGGAYFDWGDTPRNAVITKTFRVKNPSTQTAHDVTLTTEALTDTTPTNVSQHAYSLDGVTFSSSLNIGNIAPGAISPVVTVRRQVPADAALSLWWARIVASAQSWS